MNNKSAKVTIEGMYNYWKDNAMTFSETKALEKAKESLDKQIPKKVGKVVEDEQEASGFAETCPVCDTFVYDEYCCNCGQKLDWEE